MTQIDKAIEYLKNAVEVNETVDPEDMLRDIFGIKRKLVSEYRWTTNKKEIKVGDMVKVIGPSSGEYSGDVGTTFNVFKTKTTMTGDVVVISSFGRSYPLSSVELV